MTCSRKTRRLFLRPVVATSAAALTGLTALAGLTAGPAGASSPTHRIAMVKREAALRPAAVAGTASVAYAGSLEGLSEKVVGPAFTQATGYAYEGRGAGSDALSQEIASGEITPNVFESVGAGPITDLEPKFTSWYVQFAASPLVIAYNPDSHYAPELRAIADGKEPIRTLFSLLAAPGFKLGRTDPSLDPQGAAFIEMIELAQKVLHLPAGTAHAILGSGPLGGSTSPEIFDETALEPRLEAGELDASSAYLSQAVQLHLHYIKLPSSIDFGDPADTADYARATLRLPSGTVKTGKPLTVDITTIGSTDSAAAAAFVAYVLSPAGLAEYKAGGYTLLTPKLFGSTASVPAPVLSEIPGA